jgi:hypothetical protein
MSSGTPAQRAMTGQAAAQNAGTSSNGGWAPPTDPPEPPLPPAERPVA